MSGHTQVHQSIAEVEGAESVYHYNTKHQLKRGTEILEKGAIISLINSPLYYLDWAFITIESDRYRLVVCQYEKIITDRYFESLDSAKVGFLKIFQYLAFGEYHPAWSHPYTPYKKWLQEILKNIVIRYYY